MEPTRNLLLFMLFFLFAPNVSSHVNNNAYLNDSEIMRISRQYQVDTPPTKYPFSNKRQTPVNHEYLSAKEIISYSNPVNIHDLKSFKLFFVSFIYLLLIIIHLYLMTRKLSHDFRKIATYDNWQTVEAKIVSSDIMYYGTTGDEHSRPEIEYTYSANGIPYRSSNIPYFLIDSLKLSYDQKLVKKYPTGTTTTIYYNPQNPGESFLVERRYFPRIMDYLIYSSIGLFFIWFSGCIYFCWRYGWTVLVVTAVLFYFYYKDSIEKLKPVSITGSH